LAPLLDPMNVMSVPADETVLGPAPVEPVRPLPAMDEPSPFPTNPAGAPNVALPGGLTGF
jgi:hypothetical protein